MEVERDGVEVQLQRKEKKIERRGTEDKGEMGAEGTGGGGEILE